MKPRTRIGLGTRRRTVAFLIAFCAIGIVAATLWAWRAHTRNGTLRASIPARPALASFSADLTQRISAGELAVQRGSRGVDALAELGQLYHANGFLPEAVQCYRGVVALSANNARWLHRLACIYAGFGQLEDALSVWERVVREAPDYAPARIRMGDVLLKLNQPARAADAFQAALKLDPRQPHALAGLARVDMIAGRWADARTRFEQAAEFSQGRIGADLLATVYEQSGDFARAATLRARAKSSGAFHDPADPWLDEMFEDCFDVYRLTVAAGFAEHAGDSRQARRLIDRAIALAPNNAPALYQSGTFALAQRDYDRARKDFEACVRAAPDFSDGWAQLIHMHRTLGNTAAAERALAEGLTHCPTSPALLLERANRLAAAGRIADAVAAAKQALHARPNDADALVKLASFLFQLERIEEGAVALQRALIAEPEHPAALTTLALHAIGSGNEPVARQWLQRVRQQPRVPRELTEELVSRFRQQFGSAP